MRRIWTYPPELHWHGWRTLLPVYVGTDEYRRQTVMLGWTVTGRVVVAFGKPCHCRDELDAATAEPWREGLLRELAVELEEWWRAEGDA